MSVVDRIRVATVAVAVAVVVPLAGCSGSSTPSSTKSPSGNAAINVADDVAMESALRSLANCEEAYFTDGGKYAAASVLTTACPGVKPPVGVVTVHLAVTTGFCLAGSVGAGRFWIYDSTNGGIHGPASTDTCNTGIFTTAGGTITS